MILADHFHMSGDNKDVQIIYFFKLGGLCVCSTSHPGQLFIHAKIILKGNRGESLIFLLDSYPLFRLKGLMQPITPAASAAHRAP